ELRGVGFRASMSNGVLRMTLGYSHPIYFAAPDDVDVEVDTKKKKNTVIIVSGINNELVGQVAAKIRSLRPPEPYNGKGIRYVDERSEEHTSELQSRFDIVCRLLLEKNHDHLNLHSFPTRRSSDLQSTLPLLMMLM